MKVKLDDYDIRVLINGLFQHRRDYDAHTNNAIDELLLQVLRASGNMKPCRKKKFHFDHHQLRLIRMCLIEWRNQHMLDGKINAADAIGDLIILFSH